MENFIIFRLISRITEHSNVQQRRKNKSRIADVHAHCTVTRCSFQFLIKTFYTTSSKMLNVSIALQQLT